MIPALTIRMIRSVDLRLLAKAGWSCGFHGLRAVRRFQKGLKKGEVFPPFLFISITNACNLRCTGCWVDVDGPRQQIDAAALDRLINQARGHGNRFFGILGGEPFMHPALLAVLGRHRDCYFQVFTNGQFITARVAAELRRLGNVTPLVSIEGSEVVSDERRGRPQVFSHSMAGLEQCLRHRLLTGVATSVCQTNIDDLLSEAWLRRMIEMGVHYVWYYTYRPVGARPAPELAFSPEQVLRVRRFLVTMRKKLPIILVDAYWDAQGRGLCPMAVGISHHIGPGGDIEPCPIIQFARESIHDGKDIRELLVGSAFLRDFREVAAKTTRGCIVLERPDLVAEIAKKHAARDSSGRGTGLAELAAMTPRLSQHNPGNEIPEEHWAYRFAKKHWFSGLGRMDDANEE